MPYYDFKCHVCNIVFTKKALRGGLHILVTCPKCGNLCKRTGFHPVPFIFKEKP